MRINHIAIWTTDLERAKDFYIRYFNGKSNQKYENPAKGFESYFITFGDGCALEIMRSTKVTAGRPDSAPEYTGLTHMSFSAGSREAVDELIEILRKDGYPVIGETRVTGDGFYEGVILDCDGNKIEITE